MTVQTLMGLLGRPTRVNQKEEERPKAVTLQKRNLEDDPKNCRRSAYVVAGDREIILKMEG